MSAGATDPIELARARTERFWRDLEAEFGLLTAAQAAQALGVADDELAQLRQSGVLLAVELLGEVRYPGFQFTDGRPLPLMTRLSAFRLQHDVSETSAIMWLCSPTTYLRDERRPVDHLNDPDTIAAAADASWGVVW